MGGGGNKVSLRDAIFLQSHPQAALEADIRRDAFLSGSHSGARAATDGSDGEEGVGFWD